MHLPTTLLVLLVILLVNFGLAESQKSAWNIKQTPFPKAKRVSKTLSFRSAKAAGNVTLADPYQWLQNDDDPDTKKFIADQTKLTETFMQKCSSAKQIEQSVRNTFDYDNYEGLTFVDEAKIPFWFYSVIRPNEDRKTFYIATPEEMEAARKTNFATPPGKKYLMESLLSKNESASIIYASFSHDYTMWAYMVVEAGADYGTWYVRKLDSPLIQAKTFPPGGEGRLSEAIPYAYQDLKWTTDSKGFFYDSSPPVNATSDESLTVVKYHQIGTAYEKDITIVNPDPNPENFWFIDLSYDGRWLIVYGTVGTDQKAVAYATLLTGQKLSNKMKWISIVPTRQFSLLSTVGILDDHWYVTTDENALDRKMVKVKLDWSKAKQVSNLSELKDRLQFIDVVPNRPFKQLYLALQMDTNKALFAYVEKGNYVLYIFDLKTGKQIQKILPDEKSSPHSYALASQTSKYFTLNYENTVSPAKVYKLQFTQKGVDATLFTAQAIKGSNPDDYTTDLFEATSKDGTKVPYFIVRHKKRPSNTSSVLRIHGYGAYGFIGNLYWDQGIFSWLQASDDRGYVYAGARGGGDNGEEWHIAGKRRNKQKTFDDMIAVAQDLIKRKFVEKGQLVLEGASAGGLMAAAVARQAPTGTFGAILAGSAVLDYLFFNTGSIGSDNTDEFGDPNIPIEFDIIESWDPLRNLSPKVQPPPTLLTIADSDARVQPANSYKYLAQAQYNHPNSPNPLLIYISTSSGHVIDRSTTATLVQSAIHEQCFLELTVGRKE